MNLRSSWAGYVNLGNVSWEYNGATLPHFACEKTTLQNMQNYGTYSFPYSARRSS